LQTLANTPFINKVTNQEIETLFLDNNGSDQGGIGCFNDGLHAHNMLLF